MFTKYAALAVYYLWLEALRRRIEREVDAAAYSDAALSVLTVEQESVIRKETMPEPKHPTLAGVSGPLGQGGPNRSGRPSPAKLPYRQ
jgi:hypothetical protein